MNNKPKVVLRIAALVGMYLGAAKLHCEATASTSRRGLLALRRQEACQGTAGNIDNIGSLMIGFAIAIGIGLTVLTSVIQPQIVAAKAGTDFSTGEKAMIGLITFILIAAMITLIWKGVQSSQKGSSKRRY